MTRRIERKIILPASALGPDLSDHVAKVIESMEGSICTQKSGYIIRVIGDIALSTPLISNSNSEVYVTAQFEAETLLPIVGREIKGTIWKIFSEGIFLEVESVLKVLIPSATIPGYVYSADESKFNDGLLKIGCCVSGTITGVRYKRGGFSVVAEFKCVYP